MFGRPSVRDPNMYIRIPVIIIATIEKHEYLLIQLYVGLETPARSESRMVTRTPYFDRLCNSNINDVTDLPSNKHQLTLVNSVDGDRPGNSLVEYTLNAPPKASARMGRCALARTDEKISNTR